MGEPFDPYRDALVVEQVTVWPDQFAQIEAEQRRRIEQQLHEQAKDAAELEYVRLHAGFCRRITVTAADLERLGYSGLLPPSPA